MFTQNLVRDLDIKAVSWNSSEAGHGKGAVDGVEPLIKRTADSPVARGTDIPDFVTFVSKIVSRTNIIFYTVQASDITETDSLLPKTLKTNPDTSTLHQITWSWEQPEEIIPRQLSFFHLPKVILNIQEPQELL